MIKFNTFLSQRRSDQESLASPCYSEMVGTISLQVEASNGTVWVLPWNEFVAAKFFRDGTVEKLRLTFRGHEIAVQGINLQCLRPLVAVKTLATLYVIKTDFVPISRQTSIIKDIEVRTVKK